MRKELTYSPRNVDVSWAFFYGFPRCLPLSPLSCHCSFPLPVSCWPCHSRPIAPCFHPMSSCSRLRFGVVAPHCRSPVIAMPSVIVLLTGRRAGAGVIVLCLIVFPLSSLSSCHPCHHPCPPPCHPLFLFIIPLSPSSSLSPCHPPLSFSSSLCSPHLHPTSSCWRRWLSS
jgi:hypothetical protein